MKLTTFKNSNTFFYEAWQDYDKMETSLQNDFSNLIKQFEKILKSKKNIAKTITKLIPFIFELRIKTMRRFLTKKNYSHESIFKDIIDELLSIKISKLEELIESAFFFIEWNQKILISLDMKIENENIYIQNDIPKISYENFISSLLFIGNDIEAQRILEMTQASLYMESIIIFIFLISDNPSQVTQEAIDALEELAEHQSQRYLALAVQLGMLEIYTLKKDEIYRHHMHKLDDDGYLSDNDYLFLDKAYAKKLVRSSKELAKITSDRK